MGGLGYLSSLALNGWISMVNLPHGDGFSPLEQFCLGVLMNIEFVMM